MLESLRFDIWMWLSLGVRSRDPDTADTEEAILLPFSGENVSSELCLDDFSENSSSRMPGAGVGVCEVPEPMPEWDCAMLRST